LNIDPGGERFEPSTISSFPAIAIRQGGEFHVPAIFFFSPRDYLWAFSFTTSCDRQSAIQGQHTGDS